MKWLAANERKKGSQKQCVCVCKAKTSYWQVCRNIFFSPEMWLALWYCTVQLRHLLLSTGIWGAVDDPMQTRLHRAYLEFKRWCATHKIACSQPAFQQKMVAWICLFFLGLPRNRQIGWVVCHGCIWWKIMLMILHPNDAAHELSCTSAMGTWCWFAKRTMDVWWCNG